MVQEASFFIFHKFWTPVPLSQKHFSLHYIWHRKLLLFGHFQWEYPWLLLRRSQSTLNSPVATLFANLVLELQSSEIYWICLLLFPFKICFDTGVCPVHGGLGDGHTGGAAGEAGEAPESEEAAIARPHQHQAPRVNVREPLQHRAASTDKKV